MKNERPLSSKRVSLRSYDTALGLRNVDDRSAALSDLIITHTTGMSIVLAGAIKGRDIIKNARALKRVAADVLKISPYAFDAVVTELAELDLVRNLQRKGGEIVSFTESIPLIHDDIYARLGESWERHDPPEVERKFLAAIDALAQGPIAASSLRRDLDMNDEDEHLLFRLGPKAELVRIHAARDGDDIAVSPLYAFENPDTLLPLFEKFPEESIRLAFSRIRQQTGFPILMDSTPSVEKDMVLAGLLPAPTIKGADGQQRAFIVLPYGLDPALLTTRKHILERAIALVACVRCGEISGGVTPIKFPDRLLARLVDKDGQYTLKGHSSTARQYAPLIGMGVIRAVPDGSLLAAQLVPTDDNIQAVNVARSLLQRQADGMPERGNEQEAARMLLAGEDYLAPMQTISLTRNTVTLTVRDINMVWLEVTGWES